MTFPGHAPANVPLPWPSESFPPNDWSANKKKEFAFT